MASKFKITSHKVIEEITVVNVVAKCGNKKIGFAVQINDGAVVHIEPSPSYLKSTPAETIKKHKEAIVKYFSK